MAKSTAGYVDGFVLPLPKRNVQKYRKMAQLACKVWMDHGALEYNEGVADDAKVDFCMPFSKGIKSKAGETVVFAFITYKSRAHRDQVNKKVMKDPRLVCEMDPKKMPFDCRRMLYTGFKTIVAG